MVVFNQEQFITAPYITFGADPELFLQKNGAIIGAEKVIPADGLKVTHKGWGGESYTSKLSDVVLDGVQIELHPSASGCRAAVGNSMRAAFQHLQTRLKELEEKGEKIDASFTAVVEVSKEELDSLSEQSKLLGCAPSNNVYDANATISVPEAYPVRSAGGHLHFGIEPRLRNEYKRIVPIMDILIGNTSVLLDRDPKAAERRQNYGRAGECRTPYYGIEYRTLSNFWLRSYQLMSLVMGLGRLSIGVIHTTEYRPELYDPYARKPILKEAWNAEAKLLGMVDLDKVREAINTNNLALAKENYLRIRDFIAEHAPEQNGDYNCTGIDCAKLDEFDYFIKKVDEGGLEYWFPNDPMTHWTTLAEGHDTGWEAFLTGHRSTVAETFGEKFAKANYGEKDTFRYDSVISDNVRSQMQKALNT